MSTQMLVYKPERERERQRERER